MQVVFCDAGDAIYRVRLGQRLTIVPDTELSETEFGDRPDVDPIPSFSAGDKESDS